MNYQPFVDYYIKEIRPKVQEELAWFEGQGQLEDAIENAALAKKRNGKRYNHQCRITSIAIQQAYATLQSISNLIHNTKSFDELFNLLDSNVSHIHGIGELYVYDTTLRLGAYLNCLPNKIYLHSGTRMGAKKLGLPIQAKHIFFQDLPKEFQKLEAHEIEDVLCIFKDKLRKTDKVIENNKLFEKSGCS